MITSFKVAQAANVLGLELSRIRCADVPEKFTAPVEVTPARLATPEVLIFQTLPVMAVVPVALPTVTLPVPVPTFTAPEVVPVPMLVTAVPLLAFTFNTPAVEPEEIVVAEVVFVLPKFTVFTPAPLPTAIV
jgi:hypothetical protein